MAGPVITPYQFNEYTSRISDIYVMLEDNLFQMIAERLKTPQELGKDYVLQWQIEQMQQLRMFNLETIEALSEATGLATDEIQAMFADVGYKTVQSVDEQVKKAKRVKDMPNDLDERLQAYVQQVFRDFDNYVNQTLITTNYGEGAVMRMYKKIVEETTAQVLAGQKTINQVVAETVIKWREKGIDTGFIDKGGRTWQLEQYADTVLRSTVNRTYNELRLSRMDEYGIDLVLVNSYAYAREACAKIQGRVCSMKRPEENNSDYPSIYDFGYGRPDGIRGINCRHILTPFIEGVNENNQHQYDETAAHERYQIVQKQRYLERQVREAKRSLAIAETFEDEVTIQRYKKRLRERQAAVAAFVDENNLPRRYDKERVV